MKYTALISLFLFWIISCKKEISNTVTKKDYLQNVKAFLKDSLKNQDYQNLDFSKAIVNTPDSANDILIRIPFYNKSMAEDFILLKTDRKGNYLQGKIINISGDITVSDNHHFFNGNISLSSLNRNAFITSPIEKGVIIAFHAASPSSRVTSYAVLPEVVVVSHVSYIDWDDLLYYLDGMLSYSNANSGYYNYASQSGGGGGTVSQSIPMKIDFEMADSKSPISVPDYIKCFSQVADNGASCSIEIMTDIPVDGDPTKFFDWTTGSPGHTFLQIKKSNGSQQVSQNIGFYPEQGWKTTLTTAPLNGKFVDNEGHEFNASLKMNLTPAQFQSVLNEIQYLARFIRYDVDDYNCTDFALEVFNSARPGNPVQIPMYNIPGGSAPAGTSTPQGLYNTLKNMQQAGGPDAANITIPGVKGFAGSSHGPCN